jgi:probable rRNA maturation factor
VAGGLRGAAGTEGTAGTEARTPGPDGAEAAGEAGPPRLLGDIVICARRALRQARADDLPPALELAVLLAHGTLHLLGYDHETDAGQMALRQAEVLEEVEWEGILVAAR